jgi:uncharacterized protein with NAD-binding domain and iron-sulfur cluster
MGSLAAAWKLTQDPADRAKYEVTVYQRDWLLGGKGASTRNQGIDKGLRIEEHGIHLLLGFYNTALHLLRSAYDELAGDPNFPSFDDTIEPWDWVWMADEHPAGNWQPPWRVRFPADPSAVPGQGGVVPGSAALMRNAVERFGDHLSELMGLTGSESSSATQTAAQLNVLFTEGLAALEVLPRPLVTAFFDFVATLVDTLVQLAWAAVSPLLFVAEVRHAWIAVFLLGTNISGGLRDRVLLDGTDHLNHLDYRAWLKQHSAVAAPPHVSWDAPPIRALYDLAFSRVTGLAAGVSLVAVARMVLGYEGHFTYKMKGGMGEVVFAPLYWALKNRGVTFRFHHEVTQLTAAQDGGDWVVDKINLLVSPGSTSYTPTFTATGTDGESRHAWPSQPPGFASQPKNPTTLQRGTDFHVVVLGISVAGLTNALVGSLRGASPRFATMIDKATHVATQSIQLWMTRAAKDLGWPEALDAMLISYARPFNSWVDMSHLLVKEKQPTSVKSIHYLCDELRETQEGTTEADVKNNAIAWITTHSHYLWPAFDWSLLHDPSGNSGSARMDAQYFRANRIGSERYVTVGPGSVDHRLPAGKSGFRNLALAGDWVRTQLSAGCLEAATTGGFEAADAIRAGTVTS